MGPDFPHGDAAAPRDLARLFQFTRIKERWQITSARLSRLVDRAAAGEPFLIAKSGRPLVKVVPCESPRTIQRLGFLRGQGTAPTPVKEVGAEGIAALFGGTE